MALSTMAFIVTSRASSGAGRPRIGVHHSRQELLVEAAPVDPDAHGLAVVDGHLDDGAEVLVVVLAPDIARIDAVLGERAGTGRILGEEHVAVVVEVADHRHVDLAHDVRHRAGRRLGVHGDAHQLAACRVKGPDLGRRAVHVGRVRIGHGLDDDGTGIADRHAAHVDRDRLPPRGSTHAAQYTITSPA
jgi:hypothetical protein